MTDNTAKIAAKGCNATGNTEELARTLHATLGQKVVAVVELVSASRSEGLDGKETVTLKILTVEPAPNNATEAHLRELARAFYYERQVDEAGAQLRLDDDIEPKVAGVLEHGAQHRPHPYLASTLSTDDDAVCDVCGRIEDAPVHEVLDDTQDDDEEPEDTDEEEPEDTDTAVGLTAVPDPFTH